MQWNLTNIEQADTGLWECKGFYKEQDFSSTELDLKVLGKLIYEGVLSSDWPSEVR